MIYTRTINDDSTTSPKDNSTPSCEEFIEMIARKQKENQDQDQDQNVPALTPWEVNIGNRLSELGEAIITRRRIKNEWYRELCGICDFITYMEMDSRKDDSFYD